MPPEATSLDIDALRQRLAGDAVVPGDSAWDTARMAWNLAADQHPAAVVLAERADDVAATLAFAGEHGLRVAPQGPGHGALQLPALDDVVLLRTTRMTGVEIDADARTARVQAGAVWNDVVGPATEQGLTGLHGSSGGVGVVGYTLGGGLGWLARKHGFASNSVTSFDVVTADGQARTVSADSEPELFWALRGGGGAYAVVTAVDFRLVELRELYAGQLVWPLEQAPEVLAAYREWTAGAPDEVSASLKLMRFPPIPDIPEPFRGRELVFVGAAVLADEQAAADLVQPMRDVAPTYMDIMQTIPASALPMIAGDPPDPVPGIGDGLALSELPPDGAEALLALVGPGVATPLLSLELRQLGGVLTQGAADHGATNSTDADFAVYAIGMPISPEVAEALTGALRGLKDGLSRWVEPLTPPTLAESDTSLHSSFADADVQRLAKVKAAFDPDGLILSNHPVD